MKLGVIKAELREILPLRNLFLQENNFQIRYNACHERGWTDSYLIKLDKEIVGYGSIKGNENLKDRDTVFEFYIVPHFRIKSSLAFSELLSSSKADFIECQSNDLLLSSLLYQHGKNIRSDTILFEEGFTSSLSESQTIFRRRQEEDITFEHRSEPVGDWVLELNKEIIATGGFLLHYNMPFADLFMEVREDQRKKGFGSFLVQEIKKQCFLAGRVPAARTGIENKASKATLLKAGLRIAGHMLLGDTRS
jgi:hypothetical protein